MIQSLWVGHGELQNSESFYHLRFAQVFALTGIPPLDSLIRTQPPQLYSG